MNKVSENSLESFGVSRTQLPMNFITWVEATNTTREQFNQTVSDAIDRKSTAASIEYNSEGLSLEVNGITIWFDRFHFEQWIGNPLVHGADPACLGAWEDPGEYLDNHWREHAYTFVTTCLQYAEIMDEELAALS